MKAIFSILGLLLVMMVVGTLAKKQLGALPSGISAPGSMPTQTPQQQSQQLQNQVKKSVEDALQQKRPEPDDK